MCTCDGQLPADRMRLERGPIDTLVCISRHAWSAIGGIEVVGVSSLM